MVLAVWFIFFFQTNPHSEGLVKLLLVALACTLFFFSVQEVLQLKNTLGLRFFYLRR